MTTRPTPPDVFAHRGDQSRGPENTLAAFELALDAGADGIETDVRLSADGVACLVHDPDLARTTDQRGPVAQRTMDELARCTATHPGAAPEPAPVPTLAQLAQRCLGRARICLDLKVDGAVEAVRAALDAARYPLREVIVCAWNPGQLADARRFLPGAPVYYIEPRDGSPSRRDDAWFAELAAAYDGISLAFEGLDREFIRTAQNHGLQVLTWTVNAPEDLDAAILAQVQGIITDDPGALRRRLPAAPGPSPSRIPPA